MKDGTNAITEITKETTAKDVYDLTGRRVLNTENLKGIYIVGGKKVVIK